MPRICDIYQSDDEKKYINTHKGTTFEFDGATRQ